MRDVSRWQDTTQQGAAHCAGAWSRQGARWFARLHTAFALQHGLPFPNNACRFLTLPAFLKHRMPLSFMTCSGCHQQQPCSGADRSGRHRCAPPAVGLLSAVPVSPGPWQLPPHPDAGPLCTGGAFAWLGGGLAWFGGADPVGRHCAIHKVQTSLGWLQGSRLGSGTTTFTAAEHWQRKHVFSPEHCHCRC